MSNNIIDSIRLSGTTYQIQGSGGGITVDPTLDSGSTNPVANSAITTALGDKVNVVDNNVSAYTFENKISGVEYGYSEHFAGPIYIRYTGSSSSSGNNHYAGYISCYISELELENIYLYFNFSNGQITSTTVSSDYFDIEIENGEAVLTFKNGYYLMQYNSENEFVALTKTTYESGQSANVIEDTVYDVFDKLNDKIDKTSDNAVTGSSMNFSDGYLNSILYTNKTSLSSSVKIDSSTIKSSNDGLSVQFATLEVTDKILNVGSGSYGLLFSTSSYDTSINEFTITFNPNCTQYNVYNFSVRIIEASNVSRSVIIEYDSADMSAVYTGLSAYCTVTDTLSTDYKLKVTAKEGYKISRLNNSNYMVGGVDNTNPNNYISNLVTTPSYVHDGQDVIDDIYDKLDDKQDTLVSGANIKTINNQSLLGSGNINIQGGGGSPTVELTQAEYDALVTAGTVSADTYYIITDAQAGDLTNYYTKTETNTLLDTKLDVSAYTPTDLSNYYTKSETSGATQISTALDAKADTATTYTKTEVDNAITAATSTKQDTLVSSQNIKTINNESLLGSGNIDIQGGGSITIDPSLDSGSTNPVANSAITNTVGKYYYAYKFNNSLYSSPWGSISSNGCVGTTLTFKNIITDAEVSCPLWLSKINGKNIFYENRSAPSANYFNLNLVETSAITTSVTSSSTDAQVPSAKAVYDIVGNIETLLSQI